MNKTTVRNKWLLVTIVIVCAIVTSCSDHYAVDKVMTDAADITEALDSAALPVNPNHFDDMSFLAESARHNLTVHYRLKRQDYGISIEPNGAIDTVNPFIAGSSATTGHIIIDRGVMYMRVIPYQHRGFVGLVPGFEGPFNTVMEAYAASKGKETFDFNFYQTVHLTNGDKTVGPYMHTHYFGFNHCEVTSISSEYIYTLAADTLQLVERWNFPDGTSALLRYDFSAAEPINLSDVDFVFDADTELMDYLLDEFERTFGESCEGILISELRDMWTRQKERIQEVLARMEEANATCPLK